MTEKLNVGFIGAGVISRLHAKGYADNPYATLKSVADVKPDVALARAKLYGATEWCTDYRELLSDPDIDAVEILLPHHLHLPVTLDALSAGKHVSLQKPMARTMDEADQIVAAAAESGAGFRVFENFRSYQPYIRIKDMIDAGEIGDLVSMRYKVIRGLGIGAHHVPAEAYAWRFDQEKGGGLPQILDHGYHVASMIEYYFGPFERIHAMTRERGETPDIESSYYITWESAGGCFGNWENVLAPDFAIATDYYAEDDWMEITGTRGILVSTRCTGKLLDEAPIILYKDGKTRRFDDMETDWGHSFRDGAHDFASAVIEGRQPDLDARLARYVQDICLSAIRSIHTRSEIQINPPQP